MEGTGAEQKATVEKVAKDFFPGYVVAVEGDVFRLTQKESYQKQLKDDANKRALEVIEKRIRDTKPGDEIAGPAIVQQLDATTMIERGAIATVDAVGNLRITVGDSP